MKKEDELLKQLMDMTKDTKVGKIKWDVTIIDQRVGERDSYKPRSFAAYGLSVASQMGVILPLCPTVHLNTY